MKNNRLQKAFKARLLTSECSHLSLLYSENKPEVLNPRPFRRAQDQDGHNNRIITKKVIIWAKK